MTEYETFTLRCGDYDGTLPIKQEIWRKYAMQYAESITVHNPLVYALRVWIGKHPESLERPVTATELYRDLEVVYCMLGKKCPYTDPAWLGRALGSNVVALRELGMDKVPLRGGNGYKFTPSDTELERCVCLYSELSGRGGAELDSFTLACEADEL
jgi:hypothetical protein